MSSESIEYTVTQPPTAAEVSTNIGHVNRRSFDAKKLPTIALELTPNPSPSSHIETIIATIAIGSLREAPSANIYTGYMVGQTDQFAIITVPRQPNDAEPAHVTILRHRLDTSATNRQNLN